MTLAQIRGAILLSIAIASIAAVGSAAVIRVPEDRPTLGAACAVAQVGDEIVAQPGIYHESEVGRQYGISIRSAVEGEYVVIDAAGIPGSGVVIWPVLAPVVLRWVEVRSATGRGLELHASPADAVADALIEHCRFIANRNGGISIGGGDDATRSFVIRDTVVGDNVTESHGGGLVAISETSQTPILLERVAFYNNVADEDGGGVYTNRPLTAIDCLWDANGATRRGGGFYGVGTGGSAVIENGTFSKNATQGEGGGFCSDVGFHLELHDTRFVGNQASTGWAGYVNTMAYALLHCCEYTEEAVDVADDTAILVVDDSDCGVAVEAHTLSNVKALFR